MVLTDISCSLSVKGINLFLWILDFVKTKNDKSSGSDLDEMIRGLTSLVLLQKGSDMGM